MELKAIQAQCYRDSQDWFPNIADNLEHNLIGLAGEVGELLNKYKKYDRGDISLGSFVTQAHDELADVLIYLCVVAANMGADLDMEYAKKRTHNVRRFTGDGHRDHPTPRPA